MGKVIAHHHMTQARERLGSFAGNCVLSSVESLFEPMDPGFPADMHDEAYHGCDPEALLKKLRRVGKIYFDSVRITERDLRDGNTPSRLRSALASPTVAGILFGEPGHTFALYQNMQDEQRPCIFDTSREYIISTRIMPSFTTLEATLKRVAPFGEKAYIVRKGPRWNDTSPMFNRPELLEMRPAGPGENRLAHRIKGFIRYFFDL